MRRALVYQNGLPAGTLEEIDRKHYRFVYLPEYRGDPVSLALPMRPGPYEFASFPAVFEGLLPEGLQLEAMLRKYKIDRNDLFQQLLTVGKDVVGSLTIEESE